MIWCSPRRSQRETLRVGRRQWILAATASFGLNGRLNLKPLPVHLEGATPVRSRLQGRTVRNRRDRACQRKLRCGACSAGDQVRRCHLGSLSGGPVGRQFGCVTSDPGTTINWREFQSWITLSERTWPLDFLTGSPVAGGRGSQTL